MGWYIHTFVVGPKRERNILKWVGPQRASLAYLYIYIYIYIYIHTHTHIYIYIWIGKYKVSKVDNISQGWPKGSLFNSYYTKV